MGSALNFRKAAEFGRELKDVIARFHHCCCETSFHGKCSLSIVNGRGEYLEEKEETAPLHLNALDSTDLQWSTAASAHPSN
jgi:hypothetical protein